MFHQASMLFSAFVMLMGAGWYGLHTQDETLQVRETVAAASGHITALTDSAGQ